MENQHANSEVVRSIEGVYRAEARRVFATLVRMLGDFDLAEEALQDAFAAAVEQWGRDGIPANPRAWLVSAGRFKAVDTLRRRARFDASVEDLARQWNEEERASRSVADRASGENDDEDNVEDDQLRLIFTCCHPALSASTQVALTLREVCGLTTEEIASAFLTAPATIAQRIVRGKGKIRDAKIPYVVPTVADLPERLDSVLAVIYLVFNEGYSASFGDSLTRPGLSGEAIRLVRLLVKLLPDTEVIGLLALMLLHESRRLARSSPTGNVVLLEEQDRSLWDRALIVEGKSLVERALATGPVGGYSVQAAISAVHADAVSATATDWNQIVALYDVLLSGERSPIVELNRAVAVAMRDGPQAGLDLIDECLKRGDLGDDHLAHAARADLCRRLERIEEARIHYPRPLDLATQAPERRFLERRLREISEKL